MNKTAVLLTCFNRKKHTLTCLNQLFFLSQEIDVYVVDDNSSDGTSAAILEQFPDVHLIKGNGNLFWNRGMHLAWKHASKHKYDFYLWLNDDVVLYKNCFDEMFALFLSILGMNKHSPLSCLPLHFSSYLRVLCAFY